MALYLFNFSGTRTADPRPPRERAMELLRTGVWDIDPETPHRAALAPGDLALIYVAAPDGVFIGCAELDSAVQELTSSGSHADRSDLRTAVLLSGIEEWDPPVPMETVLTRIGPSEKAKAEFPVDVVRITPHEYETAVTVAAEHPKG
jgi:hypothetical protein